MDLLRNQNLSHPQVTHWESPPHLSASVTNTVMALGVLTFALQLCLVLFLMLRCWRLDKRVKEALKEVDMAHILLAAKVYHPNQYKYPDQYKQTMFSPHADSAVPMPQNKDKDTREYFYESPRHWDLVQSS